MMTKGRLNPCATAEAPPSAEQSDLKQQQSQRKSEKKDANEMY